MFENINILSESDVILAKINDVAKTFLVLFIVKPKWISPFVSHKKNEFQFLKKLNVGSKMSKVLMICLLCSSYFVGLVIFKWNLSQYIYLLMIKNTVYFFYTKFLMVFHDFMFRNHSFSSMIMLFFFRIRGSLFLYPEQKRLTNCSRIWIE